MPVEGRLLLAAASAALVAYALSPLAMRLAGRWAFFDAPAGYKGHAAPTPYLGGAAVMGGFLVALLAAAVVVDGRRTLALGVGAAALWVVGTVDDRRTVSPGARVVVEATLAAGAWALGLGWSTGAGAVFDLLLTIAWVVAVVNAFNLFDNMDGAASTMALVVSSGTGVLGAILDDAWLAAAGAGLAGACLGFLPHNGASPARIFLGDGGSMPVGFVAAILVMIAATHAEAGIGGPALAALLAGVPLTDTVLVVASRRRRGISVLTGGRDHLTHRVRRHLGAPWRVAATLGAVQAVLCGAAVVLGSGGDRPPGAAVAAAALYVVVAAAAIAALLAEERRLEAVEPGATE